MGDKLGWKEPTDPITSWTRDLQVAQCSDRDRWVGVKSSAWSGDDQPRILHPTYPDAQCIVYLPTFG